MDGMCLLVAHVNRLVLVTRLFHLLQSLLANHKAIASSLGSHLVTIFSLPYFFYLLLLFLYLLRETLRNELIWHVRIKFMPLLLNFEKNYEISLSKPFMPHPLPQMKRKRILS